MVARTLLSLPLYCIFSTVALTSATPSSSPAVPMIKNLDPTFTRALIVGQFGGDVTPVYSGVVMVVHGLSTS